MPSFAFPLWLVLAAAPGSDSLAPPPHGRPAEATPLPSGATKTPATDAASAKAPASAKSAGSSDKSAKAPPALDLPSAGSDEPTEEFINDAPTKTKGHRKSTRKVVQEVGGEVPERKSAWSADRYSAVVPPGLTLAALRSQLEKSPNPQAAASKPEHGDSPEQVLAEINKTREALRQETAHLESLLKSTGNCRGSSSGESSGSSTPMSAGALQETSGEQIDAVSKAMKGMKPEQAAALVTRLDRGLAAEILRRMKATDAGAILGILKPELAADLTTEMITRKPMKKAAPK